MQTWRPPDVRREQHPDRLHRLLWWRLWRRRGYGCYGGTAHGGGYARPATAAVMLTTPVCWRHDLRRPRRPSYGGQSYPATAATAGRAMAATPDRACGPGYGGYGGPGYMQQGGGGFGQGFGQGLVGGASATAGRVWRLRRAGLRRLRRAGLGYGGYGEAGLWRLRRAGLWRLGGPGGFSQGVGRASATRSVAACSADSGDAGFDLVNSDWPTWLDG